MFTVDGGPTGADLKALSLGGDSVRVVPVRVTPFDEYRPALSPDGSLLAYESSESNSNEIFVQEFPGRGEAWRVSTSGGSWPQWSRGGRELYYLGQDNKVMAVGVEPGSPPRFSLPHALFQIPAGRWVRSRCAVSKDGQRFLFASSSEDATVRPITVALNRLVRSEKR